MFAEVATFVDNPNLKKISNKTVGSVKVRETANKQTYK